MNAFYSLYIISQDSGKTPRMKALSHGCHNVVQFKKETTAILTVIGLTSRHADCRMISMLYPTFFLITFDYHVELNSKDFPTIGMAC